MKKYRWLRVSGLNHRLVFLLVLNAVLTASAFPAVFNVTNTADGHATNQLRGAIEAADAAGGTHTINVAAGTYNLTLSPRQLVLGTSLAQNITIIGNGPANTIINMTNDAGRDRILLINPVGTTNGVVVSIQGIKFTNGYLTSDTFGGAGIAAGGGTGDALSLTNCAFENNTIPANAFGGAAANMQVSGNLTIDNCTFTNNTSNDADGGAVLFIIYNGAGRSGNLTVTRSTFTGNSVVFPGAGTSKGGALAFSGQGGIVGSFGVNITGNTFINNTADGLGGAISANNSPNLTTSQIHYNRFIGNTSAAGAASNGLHFVESSGSVNADSNWWGCNTGPAAAPCDRAGGDVAGGGSLTTSPWLQLRNVPSKTSVVVGETLTMTADILGLSTGGSTAASNLVGLAAFPLASSAIFSNPVRGTLSATNGQFVNGVANLTPTFTATTVGAGSADATADSQTVTSSAITIGKASTTASIISDSPDPSNVGQNVVVSYSVAVTSPGGGTPTGSVQVSDGVNSCSGTVAAGQCTVALNTAGNRTLTATYLGDTNYNASPASAGASHVVGQVTWTGATNTAFSTNTNWNTGLAPGSADTAIIPAGAGNQPAIGGAASVSSLSVAAGRILTVNSSLTVGGTLTNNGTIQGTGTIVNNFTNGANGIVAPGLSPGILNITGNYTNAGAFNVEIGGTAGAGVNPNGHDQLLVSGTGTLGGTLNVTLTNGFTPAGGNSFVIFDAASSTGTFATVNLPNILPNTWNVAYNNAAGTVTLTVMAPTAANASVSGRVFDANGRGLSRARVSITDSTGNVVYALTNPFGYYRLQNIAAGQTYVISVAAKGHQFTPRAITVSEDLTDVDFISGQ